MAIYHKIKCESEKQYEKIKLALDLSAIEYYQVSPSKPIILYGFNTKKEIKKILKKYGLKKYDIKEKDTIKIKRKEEITLSL